MKLARSPDGKGWYWLRGDGKRSQLCRSTGTAKRLLRRGKIRWKPADGAAASIELTPEQMRDIPY